MEGSLLMWLNPLRLNLSKAIHMTISTNGGYNKSKPWRLLMEAKEWRMKKLKCKSTLFYPSFVKWLSLSRFVDRYIPGYVFFGDGILRGAPGHSPPWLNSGLSVQIGLEREVVGISTFWIQGWVDSVCHVYVTTYTVYRSICQCSHFSECLLYLLSSHMKYDSQTGVFLGPSHIAKSEFP